MGRTVLLDVFFFSSSRRTTRWPRDWSSDVCSSDLGGSEVVGTAGFHESVPERDGFAGLHPDLVAEVARVARPRDVHRDTGDPGRYHPEVFQAGHVPLRTGPEDVPARRPLQGDGRGLLRDVLDLGLEAEGVLPQPAQAGLGGRPPEEVLGQAGDRAVVDDLPLAVA